MKQLEELLKQHENSIIVKHPNEIELVALEGALEMSMPFMQSHFLSLVGALHLAMSALCSSHMLDKVFENKGCLSHSRCSITLYTL